MHEKRFEGGIERLRSPDRVERLDVDLVVDLCLEGKKSQSVLDVGTGTGLFAGAFSQRGLEVAGVDVNAEMLAAARKYVPQADFRLGAAEALPYKEHSFDFVFLGLVLHESDDPLEALMEARRVARQQVGILEWPFQEGAFGPPLAHRLNPQVLANLFRKAGFRNWAVKDLSNTVFYRLEV